MNKHDIIIAIVGGAISLFAFAVCLGVAYIGLHFIFKYW